MSRHAGSSSRRRSGGRVTPGRADTTSGSLVWWGPFLNNSGYGEEARGFLRALNRRGIHVGARSTGDDSATFVELLKESPELALMLSEGFNRQVGTRPVTAVVHTPGHALRRVPDADFTVGRTMFETDRLPPGWVTQINLLDEIWVPSSFNVETFRSAGVTVPIGIVPSGVDGSAYRPGLKPLPLPGLRGCTFLSVFEWSHRKAPDVLLRAWAEAFNPRDDVSLVLRCYTRGGFDGDSGSAVNEMVDRELASIGVARTEVAPIVVLGKQLSSSSMARLVSSADVFVGVSRGEGWGRPLLEAMACGVTTIGTRWGGNVDFMDDRNSLLVDIDGLVPVDERMDMAFYHGHRWAEPSVTHLVELLRTAATEPGLRRSLGKKARADVERRWQWSHVAGIVESRLGGLLGRGRTPSIDPAETTTLVHWRGDILADHSLATVNRELVKRLAASTDLRVEALTVEIPQGSEYLSDLSGIGGIGIPLSRAPVSVEVRHAWPPDFSLSTAQRLVMIQPWEFGGIPDAWIGPMSTLVDETWVPSTWVRDCYIRSGVPAERIAVVPHGVDTSIFTPDGPALSPAVRRSVRLLFVGGTISRKGFDLLLDTYLTTFGPDDDVCLVIKPFGSDTVYRDSNMDDRVRAVMANPRSPAIELIDRRLSREEMAMLYRSCDVLVHPYRGEGFGLPVAEAMACGLPALVTGYGACLDFCDNGTGWLIPAREVPVQLPDMSPGPAGFWWAEPDALVLGQLLVQAAASTGERKSLGEKACQRIVNSFTWDRAARESGRRLRALTCTPEAERPAAPSGFR